VAERTVSVTGSATITAAGDTAVVAVRAIRFAIA
jgi:hypothetical protein